MHLKTKEKKGKFEEFWTEKLLGGSNLLFYQQISWFVHRNIIKRVFLKTKFFKKEPQKYFEIQWTDLFEILYT